MESHSLIQARLEFGNDLPEFLDYFKQNGDRRTKSGLYLFTAIEQLGYLLEDLMAQCAKDDLSETEKALLKSPALPISFKIAKIDTSRKVCKFDFFGHDSRLHHAIYFPEQYYEGALDTVEWCGKLDLAPVPTGPLLISLLAEFVIGTLSDSFGLVEFPKMVRNFSRASYRQIKFIRGSIFTNALSDLGFPDECFLKSCYGRQRQVNQKISSSC